MNTLDILKDLEEIKFPKAELDPIKIKDYLSKIKNPELKEVITFILQNTQYISTETLIQNIKDNLLKFIKENTQKYRVHLPEKIGSDWYCVAQVYKELITDPNFESFLLEKDIQDNKTNQILVIDDFSLTGTHILNIMDTIALVNPFDLNFHVFLGATTVTTFEGSLKGDSYKHIQSINLHYSKRLKALDELSENKYINLYNLLGSETELVTPFFTDHKIPNTFGSFPQIYLLGCLDTDKRWKNQYGHLFKVKPSRKQIGKIELKYSIRQRSEDRSEDKIIEDDVDSEGDLYFEIDF